MSISKKIRVALEDTKWTLFLTSLSASLYQALGQWGQSKKWAWGKRAFSDFSIVPTDLEPAFLESLKRQDGAIVSAWDYLLCNTRK